MAQPQLPKRDDRDPVALAGSAVLRDGREIAVLVTNLSKEGCRIEADEPLRPGDQLSLNVELLQSAAASVRWSISRTAGLCFDDGDWT
jgi:hypothetical protein